MLLPRDSQTPSEQASVCFRGETAERRARAMLTGIFGHFQAYHMERLG